MMYVHIYYLSISKENKSFFEQIKFNNVLDSIILL